MMRGDVHMARVLVVAVIVVAAAAGCKQVCEPQETQICYCAGGEAGVQTCNSQGTGWSSCDCGEVDSSTDAEVDSTGTDVEQDTTDDGPEPEPECVDDGDCDDDDPCTQDSCTSYGTCSNVVADVDGDGYFAMEVDGEECGGLDCDDTDDSVFPDAEETSCTDGVDQDCHGPNVRIDAEMGIHQVEGLSGVFGTFVWTGSDFRVASGSDHLARVAADGTMMGSATEMGIDPAALGMAWTGSELGLMAWKWDTIEDLVFARYDDAGAMVGSVVELTEGAEQPSHAGASLAWTGSEFVGIGVTGGTSSQMQRYFRLDAEGVVQAENSWDIQGGEINSLQVIWTGSETAAFWTDLRGGPESVYMARINPDGVKVAEDQRLTEMELADLLTDVAWTGSEFAMTWQTHTGSEELVKFTRLDRFGGRLGTEISTDGQLAWTGSEFVVLNGRGEYSRVGADGELHILQEGAQIPPETMGEGMEFFDVTWVGDGLAVLLGGSASFRILQLKYCF